MSTAYSSNTNSHYNPNEPRDERGRWTTGGSSWRNNPVRRPEPAGRAHLLLGHAHASAWHQGLIRQFKLPTDAEAEQFARTIGTWNAAADLDLETFRESFTRGLVDKPATVARLRKAAAGAAEAQTIGRMVDASRPLTQAIREIGADRVKRSDQAKGFVVLPKRWIVERTFGWLGRCRRLAKHFENLTRTALAFLRLAMIRLMVRRLARAPA